MAETVPTGQSLMRLAISIMMDINEECGVKIFNDEIAINVADTGLAKLQQTRHTIQLDWVISDP